MDTRTLVGNRTPAADRSSGPGAVLLQCLCTKPQAWGQCHSQSAALAACGRQPGNHPCGVGGVGGVGWARRANLAAAIQKSRRHDHWQIRAADAGRPSQGTSSNDKVTLRPDRLGRGVQRHKRLPQGLPENCRPASGRIQAKIRSNFSKAECVSPACDLQRVADLTPSYSQPS